MKPGLRSCPAVRPWSIATCIDVALSQRRLPPSQIVLLAWLPFRALAYIANPGVRLRIRITINPIVPTAAVPLEGLDQSLM